VGWNAVPAAGGGYATSGLGRPGAPPAGTKTGRKELADGERYPFSGWEWISRQKRGPAS
jgi:hypothetical protein